MTLAFCVTSTKQRRTEPNVGGDRPRQPAVDGGSRTLGRAPRWGANVAWGSLPRVRCATLGYDVQPRCGCREGHCQILELGTWNLETVIGLPGKASARLLSEKNAARRAKFIMRLNPQADWGIGHRIVWRIGEDRNDGGTIVILPILPIPNDTAVFGLTGKAQSQRRAFIGSMIRPIRPRSAVPLGEQTAR